MRFQGTDNGHNSPSLHERITRDPKVMGGQPVFKGTRVTLSTVLSTLAEGAKPEEVLRSFPSLTEADVYAAIAFAAASARDDLPQTPLRPAV